MCNTKDSQIKCTDDLGAALSRSFFITTIMVINVLVYIKIYMSS